MRRRAAAGLDRRLAADLLPAAGQQHAPIHRGKTAGSVYRRLNRRYETKMPFYRRFGLPAVLPRFGLPAVKPAVRFTGG